VGVALDNIGNPGARNDRYVKNGESRTIVLKPFTSHRSPNRDEVFGNTQVGSARNRKSEENNIAPFPYIRKYQNRRYSLPTFKTLMGYLEDPTQ
jgi:hypothetical protein